jgi:hypothetical protein
MLQPAFEIACTKRALIISNRVHPSEFALNPAIHPPVERDLFSTEAFEESVDCCAVGDRSRVEPIEASLRACQRF